MNRNILAVVCATLTLLFSQCKEEILVDIKEIIRFTTTQHRQALANNIDTINLKVQIPANSSASTRSITFDTDFGTFTNGANSVTVAADENGVASVFLKSDKAGTANVKATISGVAVSTRVAFNNIVSDEQIKFVSLDQNSLVADNLELRRIEVQVDINIPLTERNVIFTTDLGTFSNDQTTITVPANDAGRAFAFLKADKVGQATVGAQVKSYKTAASLQTVAPDPDQVLKLLPLQISAVPADGVSRIMLQVQTDIRVPPALRNVEFKTDRGSFQEGTTMNAATVASDVAGVATAFVNSRDEGETMVTVTHRQVVRTFRLRFVRAFPEALRFDLPFVINAGLGNKVTIITFLSRSVGVPGKNFAVRYSATDSSQRQIGQFNNNTPSDNDGKCSVVFTAGNTNYRGKITIHAEVVDAPAAKNNAEITVVDP